MKFSLAAPLLLWRGDGGGGGGVGADDNLTKGPCRYRVFVDVTEQRLCSQHLGSGKVFDRLKNLTGLFVHMEPFNISVQFTRN